MRSIIITSILLALIPLTTHAVSLAPSVLEIQTKRGSVVEQTISVINTKGMEQTYFLGVLKFTPSADGGSPQFISSEVDHSGLPQWIQLPFTEFRVAANSKASVPFAIAVPTDVASGGYYAAITVSQAPSDVVADNGAVIEAKVASLILLTVEGDTVEKLELLDFSAVGANVRSSLSGSYVYRLQNQGNVHVMPTGTVNLTDVFGRKVMSLDANPELGRVLPSSTRSYRVEGASTHGFFQTVREQMAALAVGPMTAQLELTYGTSGETIFAQQTVWYFPWQLILSVIVLLMILKRLFTRKQRDR